MNILASVRSVYRWESRIERDHESLLLIKTTSERFEALRNAIAMTHPHAVPELLALDVAAGPDRYLDWVRAEVTPTGTGE